MNIQLKPGGGDGASSKRQKTTILSRGTTRNVLMDSSGSGSGSGSDEDEGALSQPEGQERCARLRVNAELMREQDALRKRTGLVQMQLQQRQQHDGSRVGGSGKNDGRHDEAAAIDDVYDYDGAYDTFLHPLATIAGAASRKNDNVTPTATATTMKASKYMSGLLRAASERQRERELRIERKVAREIQAEEEADAQEAGVEGRVGYANKDKFVTSAYKQKLRERELWHQEQQEKEREEKEADVTRRGNSSLAMASFYSNLNRNVAMGGGRSQHAGEVGDDGKKKRSAGSRDEGADERSEDDEQRYQVRREDNEGDDDSRNGFEQRPVGRGAGDEGRGTNGGPNPSLTRRQLRDLKVEEARARYFERHPERRREDAVTS
jgi:coiled-coil domain-containing protein 55